MSQPAWTPSPTRAAGSQMAAFLGDVSKTHGPLADYQALWQWSIDEPEAFWSEIWDAADIVCDATASQILGRREMPGAEWFVGAQLNFAANLLRHDGDATALLSVCEHREDERTSYAQLRTLVARCAAALRREGVVAGDRVAGYVPNFRASVVAMLAATSLGAVWSSCSPDFGRQGVLDRFGQIEPTVLFAADGYVYGGKRFDVRERVAEIRDALPSLRRVVIVPWLEEQPDLSLIADALLWDDFLVADVDPPLEFAPLPFDHPVYILYSSGTTGVPKCIVHGAGGTLLQHYKELALHTDVRDGDVLFYFTTCGWMMWNWLVSGLMVGATVMLYDGSPGAPSLSMIWDAVDRYGMNVLGTSPKFLGICRNEGIRPRDSHDLSSLRTILSTGAPLLPEDFDFVYEGVKPDVQLASISGGTDIISCFALGNPMLPVYRGQLQSRGLGMAVDSFGPDAKPIRGGKGELVCTQPAPSMPVSFWNDEDGARYRRAYFDRFPGIWTHGDFIEITPEQGIIIYGRSDATLNPGGVRIGTAEIYRQVETTEAVADSLAVGVEDQGDQMIVLFVVLNEGFTLDEALIKTLKARIRSGASPRHVPRHIRAVGDVPYTISGKKVELAVTQLLAGEEPPNRDALKNPDALDLYRGFSFE